MAYVGPAQYGFPNATRNLLPGALSPAQVRASAEAWKKKNAPRIPSLGVDALYAVRGQPGAASNYYKFSTDPNSPYNIFGNRYLGKLQADWAKGITSGGNKQIHKILTGLGTSKTGSKQNFVKRNPNVGKLFAQYFRTGVVPRGLTPDLARHAYDYALRATGRDAVMDRQGSFFGNLVKGNLGAIAGTALGFAVPGLGMALGGALGGAIQGGVSGGLKGAALGGLGGYGLGSGASWLAGKAGTLAGNAAQSLGAHKLGATLSPKVTNLNALLSKSAPANSFFKLPSFAERTSTGIATGHAAAAKAAAKRVAAGNAVPGAKTGINTALPQHGGGLSPVSAASQKGLAKSVIDSAATGAASQTGASKMAVPTWLSGITSGAKTLSTNVADFAKGVTSTIQPLTEAAQTGLAAYNLFKTFNPPKSSNLGQHGDQLVSQIERLYGENQFRPMTFTTPMGQARFTGGGAEVYPSTESMRDFNRLNELVAQTGDAALDFDTFGQAQRFLEMDRALKDIQDARNFASFESRLFNEGGIHSGTRDQSADYQNLLAAGRAADRRQAIDAAFNMGTGLQDRHVAALQARSAFNQALMNPVSSGVDFGRVASASNIPLVDMLADAQGLSTTYDILEEVRRQQARTDALNFGSDFLGRMA